jgi:S1-C subfamily serine protease
VLPADHSYSGRSQPVNGAQALSDSIINYRGCSGVVIANKGGRSYIATAGHCAGSRQHGFDHNGKSYRILKMWPDKERDICFLEVEGVLPTARRLLKNKPSNKVDTTIGFVNGRLTRLSGRAIPGQSGGGIFTEDGALWGIVSTTGAGVSIYPALERMGLLWILK